MKFFHKLRRRLLSENKLSKYLLYAAGEIILVVVGILIALQINNWNQAKATQQLETELLTDLLENLELNVDQIDRQLRWDSLAISSSAYILDLMDGGVEEDQFYKDGLDIHFHRSRRIPSPFLTSSAYTALENKGFEIISSKELRKQIITLFGDTYPSMVSEIENVDQNVIKPKTQFYMIDHFEILVDGNDMTYLANDFEALMKDQDYRNILSFNQLIQEYFMMLRKDCKAQIQDLIVNVKTELDTED